MAETLTYRTISRTTIPAGTAASANFSLNALDHAVWRGFAEVVYFYHYTLDPVRLQHSLKRTLQEFPMLCGQLRSGPDSSLSIGYPHPGVLFTVREVNLPMSKVKSGLHEAYTVYDFIEKINSLLLKRQNRPLATFRITHMKGGGSALGISISHALADGYSFYYFIKRWSQIHNGLTAEPPLHDRSLLACTGEAASSLPISAAGLPRTCGGFRLLTAWQLFRLISRFLVQQRSVVCRILRFSSSQAMAIKSAAGRQGPVSLNDALTAHLWQFCTRLQNSAYHSAPRKLLIPANMRPIIDHPLSKNYFGNAISNAVVECSIGALTGGNIASIANICRQRVNALDREYFKEQMLWLREQEKNKNMLRVQADVNPFAGDCFITSLFRMPVYAACFDGHMPAWAGIPAVPIPWVLFLMPAPGESGGIDVYANLPRSAADKLKLDAWQAELYKYGEADDAALTGEPGD